jgi:hypothetical protein
MTEEFEVHELLRSSSELNALATLGEVRSWPGFSLGDWSIMRGAATLLKRVADGPAERDF